MTDKQRGLFIKLRKDGDSNSHYPYVVDKIKIKELSVVPPTGDKVRLTLTIDIDLKTGTGGENAKYQNDALDYEKIKAKCIHENFAFLKFKDGSSIIDKVQGLQLHMNAVELKSLDGTATSVAKINFGVDVDGGKVNSSAGV